MKLRFSGQILEKYSNTKFRNSPSSGSRVVACNGQTRRRRETDVHDEANSHFSQFYSRSKMLLKWMRRMWTSSLWSLAEALCKESPNCKTLIFCQAFCWDTTPCCRTSIFRRFEESSCLHFQGLAVPKKWRQNDPSERLNHSPGNITSHHKTLKYSTLIIYMQSNKIHEVFYWVSFSALMLARHVSDLTGPSSGAFYKLYLQTFGIWYYCAYYSTRPAATAGRVE